MSVFVKSLPKLFRKPLKYLFKPSLLKLFSIFLLIVSTNAYSQCDYSDIHYDIIDAYILGHGYEGYGSYDELYYGTLDYAADKYEECLIYSDYDAYIQAYYESLYAAQYAYEQFLRDQLDNIRSGSFTVIDNTPQPNQDPIEVTSVNLSDPSFWGAGTPTITGTGNFDIAVSTGGFFSEGDQLDVYIKHGNTTFSTTFPDDKLKVRGMGEGTYNFTLGLCVWQFVENSEPLYGCMDLAEVIITIFAPPVPEPNPTPYVINDEYLYEGNADNCTAGFLGIRSSNGQGELCVAGENIDENTNSSGAFVDIIICDVLGLCESARGKVVDGDNPSSWDDAIDDWIDFLISLPVVVAPNGRTLDCATLSLPPSPIGIPGDYPFDLKSNSTLLSPLTKSQSKALEKLDSWTVKRFAGEHAESMVAKCLKQLNWQVSPEWPLQPNVRVTLNWQDPNHSISPEYGFRVPDIAARRPGSSKWEFIEVKSTMTCSIRYNEDQIRKDRIIESTNFYGLPPNPGGIIGWSPPTRVSLVAFYYFNEVCSQLN